MDISIVKEQFNLEKRVPLTPGAVGGLVKDGHGVYVQSGAGEGSGFSNEDYTVRGAKIVYTQEEAYGRGEVVLKISTPRYEDFAHMRSGCAIMSFLNLVMASPKYLDGLLGKSITAIGYEVIVDEDGSKPVLSAVSEMAGTLAVQIASQYHQSDRGGMGILLGGGPGVPPAQVLVLGAGSAGMSAARTAASLGALVVLVDRNIKKLRLAEHHLGRRMITGIASQHGLAEWTRMAEVIIGAVYIPGVKTPVLVTEEMVAAMKPKSVIVDLSIDQGGCIATSRATTIVSPTFVHKGVTHYCVPNLTTCISRSASIAISHVLFRYVEHIAGSGLGGLRGHSELASGTYTHGGRITMKSLAQMNDREFTPIETIG